MDRPLLLLLLPRPLESFILRDQAEDLLRADGVVAVEPARLPYGAVARMPDIAGAMLASGQARRLLKSLPGTPKAVAIFHPFQYPLARAIVARKPDCELWYGRWDRYERAYDASPRLRGRLEELHGQAARRSALTFVVSEKLAALERDEDREPVLVPLAADSFPAPDPSQAVVAVSLGHHGWRTDWSLLRGVLERMPELVVLAIGERHDSECASDPDFGFCRDAPQIVWLGRRSDDEAARLILCARVGILPFERSEFNDAGLPYRILKFARLGRRTVSPPLAGVRTWERAVVVADSVDDWVAALRDAQGPDQQLREWALAQTAARQNEPLWERLVELGVV